MKKLFVIVLIITAQYVFNVSKIKANPDSGPEKTLHLIDSLNHLCSQSWQGEPSKSIQYGERALALANSINSTERIVISLKNLGEAHLFKGEHHTALHYLYNSLKISRAENNKDGIKGALLSIGILYFRLGDFQNALFYHTEALKANREVKDKIGIAHCLINIGLVYQKLKDYETALKYYFEAHELFKGFEKEELFIGVNNNIGNLFFDQQQYEKAVEYFNQSVLISEANGSKKGLSDAYKGLGKAFVGLKDLKLAENNFYNSLKLSQEMSDKINISENYFYLAKLAFSKSKYEEALEYNYKSHELALDMSAKSRIMENYELYAQIYSKLKDFDGAYYHLSKATNLREALYNESISKSLTHIQMAEEEAKYRQALYLKDLELKDIKEKKAFLSVILLLLLLVCLLVFLMYRNKEKQRKVLDDKNIKITLQKQEIEQQREELKIRNTDLQSAQLLINQQNECLSEMNEQLDEKVKVKTAELILANDKLEKALGELDSFIYKTSHDIRGPLARLMGLCNVALIDVKHAKSLSYFRMLNDNANYLNSTLVRLLTVVNIKNAEIQEEVVDFDGLIQNILQENQVHEGFEKIRFDINVDKSLKYVSDPSIIKLILFNLIENSILFYNNQKEIESFVSVMIHSADDKVLINVVDNGIGIDAENHNLFEMFSKATTGSTTTAGLGLYISKVCVERLKGSIRLIKNPSNFTEFLVELPNSEIKSKKRKKAITI